jgi:hypothetical protein
MYIARNTGRDNGKIYNKGDLFLLTIKIIATMNDNISPHVLYFGLITLIKHVMNIETNSSISILT